MAQTLNIPAGSNSLTFWAENFVCAGGAADFARVLIDGNELWRVDGTDASCGVLGYRQVTVDISAFANDSSHTLTFDSTSGSTGTGSNFFIDDVEIVSAPVCGVAQAPQMRPEQVPATDHLRLVLLAVMIGLLGLFVVRRQQL